MEKIFKTWRIVWHLFGGIIPIIYYFSSLNKIKALSILTPFLLLFLIFDFVRLKNPKLNEKFFSKLSFLIQENEKLELNASTYFLISSFLSILLFSKNIAIIVLLFLTFGDTMANFVGKKFGKIKIFQKTLEGSMACFLVCLFISLTLFNFKISFIAAFVATLAELFSFRINDNLLIPILAGIIMSIII